jgi:hypothetical protein
MDEHVERSDRHRCWVAVRVVGYGAAPESVVEENQSAIVQAITMGAYVTQRYGGFQDRSNALQSNARESRSNGRLAIEPRTRHLKLPSKAEERRLVAIARDKLN